MFLGFDISTAIIGVSGVDKQGEIIFCEHCDLRKHKDIFAKVDKFREFLNNIKHLQTTTQEIWVEQPFMFFNSGGSSAKTMAVLQRFNGMASLSIRDVFHLDPQYIGANEARKLNGIKVPRGTKAKQEVLKFIIDNDPGFEIEYTRYGNPQAQYYDRADSLVVARAGRAIWNQKNSES